MAFTAVAAPVAARSRAVGAKPTGGRGADRIVGQALLDDSGSMAECASVAGTSRVTSVHKS